MKNIKPRNWQTTNAIAQAKAKPFPTVVRFRGKEIPAFNGSQNNPNNKKRPITLPGVDKEVDSDLK